MIDSWTEPDFAVTVGQLKLRCLVIGLSSDFTLEDHCDPGNLAVSGKFALTNQDRIARNVTSLRAVVGLLGADQMTVALRRPLSVRHEVVNGGDTVVWFDWMPVDLDPQSTHVEEIAFDQHGSNPTPWEAVRRPMFSDSNNPAWTGVNFTVWATVFGEPNEREIFRCTSQFKSRHLAKRRKHKRMQNRVPFDCEGGQAVGLVKQ